ncbi:hypothetical protein FJ444_14265 [Aestuariibacter sp. GS-14]|uniref:hypothetical protein n=1 Tax=Aestuariibacter sp. GS-14 TaxID=2590670 RepID=UPI001128C9FB|nr:hypothetical protein [Aestuariibacter sp. GS-14]TPV56916.1 hypothetical protein FJ444_14265 [Aestuariibacter sp. GS-14]
MTDKPVSNKNYTLVFKNQPDLRNIETYDVTNTKMFFSDLKKSDFYLSGSPSNIDLTDVKKLAEENIITYSEYLLVSKYWDSEIPSPVPTFLSFQQDQDNSCFAVRIEQRPEYYLRQSNKKTYADNSVMSVHGLANGKYAVISLYSRTKNSNCTHDTDQKEIVTVMLEVRGNTLSIHENMNSWLEDKIESGAYKSRFFSNALGRESIDKGNADKPIDVFVINSDKVWNDYIQETNYSFEPSIIMGEVEYDVRALWKIKHTLVSYTKKLESERETLAQEKRRQEEAKKREAEALARKHREQEAAIQASRLKGNRDYYLVLYTEDQLELSHEILTSATFKEYKSKVLRRRTLKRLPTSVDITRLPYVGTSYFNEFEQVFYTTSTIQTYGNCFKYIETGKLKGGRLVPVEISQFSMRDKVFRIEQGGEDMQVCTYGSVNVDTCEITKCKQYGERKKAISSLLFYDLGDAKTIFNYYAEGYPFE